MTNPLTTEEELKLRAFSRQVDRLRNSSIVTQGKLKLSKTTQIDFTTGEIKASFSGYEPDAFHAQLPILRQFILQDSVNFGHICNIIYSRCSRSELKVWIAEARKKWNEKLQELPSAVDQNLHGAVSSLEDALHRLFYGYGGLFHVDINAPDEEEAVAAIEGALIHAAMPNLWWCLNVVDSVINWWLDAPHEPVPELPTQKE